MIRFGTKFTGCLWASLILMSGCSSDLAYDREDSGPQHAETSSNSFPSQYIDKELTKEIASLEQSLRNFSQFFLAQDEHIRLPQHDLVVLDKNILHRRVFIDWSGPVDRLLEELGQKTGYQVQVLGAKPVIPPLVSFYHEKIALIDVLRDAALQVHQKADLVIYPDEQLIELRYR